MLHARGDVSDILPLTKSSKRYAPRTWRCFRTEAVGPRIKTGMNHPRGDVSIKKSQDLRSGAYAPRTWRCFHIENIDDEWQDVCSTHVEMFLSLLLKCVHCLRMLHARGDVSITISAQGLMIMYAPRTWRCFHCQHSCQEPSQVCSTHVEMFPHRIHKVIKVICMLHARGDVSVSGYPHPS